MCYINFTIFDNNVVDAIGVFKSEIMSDFMQFEEKGKSLEMILQQGINLNKLDKGCLIFNYKKENVPTNNGCHNDCYQYLKSCNLLLFCN